MKKRYITGFDGLRTIGVLGVILYHIYPTIFRGGYLGVVLFFVVSGYLITDILLYEFETKGKVNIKQFYLRRLKRLYPLMIAVLLLVALYMFFFQKNMLNQMRMVSVSSLLGFNNWWQIANGGSYFARLMAVAPFNHFYSLAIEAQFYLFWPLIVIIFLKKIKSRSKIFLVLSSITLLSVLEMAILFKSGQDPTRIYYGTDTRLFSILMGSSLAFVLPSYRVDRLSINKKAKRTLDYITITIFVLMMICMFYMPDQNWIPYRGGMWFYSFLTMCLVGLTVIPTLNVNRWLTNSLFTYIGTRSYGLYLWQIPVLTLAELKISNPHSPLSILIQLLLLLFITEIGYQLIEKPFRNMKWESVKRKLKVYFRYPIFSPKHYKKLFPIDILVLISLFAIGVIITSPNKSQAQAEIKNQLSQNQEKMKNDKNKSKNVNSDIGKLSKKYNVNYDVMEKAVSSQISIVGDSMVVMTYDQLNECFPKAFIDGQFGRSPSTAVALVQNVIDNYPNVKDVVISLGVNTDGPQSLNKSTIDQVMDISGNLNIYWFNLNLTKSQYYWTESVNSTLDDAEKEYKNFHVVDWYDNSLGKENNLLTEDMTHPNEEGSVIFASTLMKTMYK